MLCAVWYFRLVSIFLTGVSIIIEAVVVIFFLILRSLASFLNHWEIILLLDVKIIIINYYAFLLEYSHLLETYDGEISTLWCSAVLLMIWYMTWCSCYKQIGDDIIEKLCTSCCNKFRPVSWLNSNKYGLLWRSKSQEHCREET